MTMPVFGSLLRDALLDTVKPKILSSFTWKENIHIIRYIIGNIQLQYTFNGENNNNLCQM